MKVMARFLVLALLTSLALPSLLVGQTATGGIRGVVRDESGAIIPGVTITVTNKGTGISRQIVTDETGAYLVISLQPAVYEVKAELASFQTQVQTVTVLTGANANADFKLKVGLATEVIQVTSGAAQINLTDYKIDGVVAREQIENLPLNGRNFLELAQLEPGVEVTAVSNPGSSPNNFFRVSIAGASQALTRISVDGATINDRVTGGTAQNFSQETVQEFQISTFNFDLATSVTGVGSINVVSRTGTNDIHGSGFFFFRDHNMAGYPGLKRDLRDPDPFFARRQSGFNLGGPLKKDKLFWFTNFEYNNQTSVFTVAHDDPIFVAFDHIAQSPLKAKLFNVRFDYKVNEKHNAFLRFSQDINHNFAPESGGLESHWTRSENFAAQGLLGVTSVLTPRMVNDVRYSYSYYGNNLKAPTDTDCTISLGCIGAGGPRIVVAGGGPTMGNHLNVPQRRKLRTYQWTDTLSWQKGNHRWRFGGEWEHFYGNGTWGLYTAGNYTVFGPSIVKFYPDLYDKLPASLRSTTAGTPTYADILKLPFAAGVVAFGDDGQPQKYNGEKARHNNRYRLFVQDSWRIGPRFTLSYGLAWSFEDNVVNHDLDRPEYLRPLMGGANANLGPTPKDYNNFQPAMGFAWSVDKSNKTVIRAGAGVYMDSNLFYSRLQERAYIGPRGNGLALIPTSAIANPYVALTGRPTLSFPAPTVVNIGNVTSLIPIVRSQILQLWGDGTDLSIRGVDVIKTVPFFAIFQHDVPTPYTIHATGGIQRELARNLVLQADFVMRRAVKFGGTFDTYDVDENRYDRPKVTSEVVSLDSKIRQVRFVNDPVIPLCTGLQGLDPKAKCSQGAITIYRSAANFLYTGLHVKLDKRFSNRYQFTLSYAFSRNTGWNGIIDLNNLNASYGIAGSDRPHRFTLSGIYDLPFYNGAEAWVRGFLNGWQLSTIHQMRSSPPLNPTIGVDIDGDGTSRMLLPGMDYNGFGRSTDANHLRGLVDDYNARYPSSVTGKRSRQNQEVPVVTLPDKFSNGDTFFSTDVRLSRIFRIRERTKLTFLVEGFNVFNVANLSGYRSSLEVPNFGTPTTRTAQVFGTGGIRAFQLGIRLSF